MSLSRYYRERFSTKIIGRMFKAVQTARVTAEVLGMHAGDDRAEVEWHVTRRVDRWHIMLTEGVRRGLREVS